LQNLFLACKISSMTLKELIQQVRAQLKKFDSEDIDPLANEIATYLNVGSLLPSIINWKKETSIRKAQKALSKMEGRLDRIVKIHHDAKRVLQSIAAVEYQLLGALVRAKKLDKKSSGPAQQLVLASVIPILGKTRAKWLMLDIVCTQAQQRIASAKDSIRQQWRLDDNLRWAQERSPG
jgi:hypothetical protein